MLSGKKNRMTSSGLCDTGVPAKEQSMQQRNRWARQGQNEIASNKIMFKENLGK